MTCQEEHHHIIASALGNSQPVDDPEKARRIYNQTPGAVWVAIHRKPIQQLVENPTTIEIYCEEESHRQEQLETEEGKES